jgi:hypothetical protein
MYRGIPVYHGEVVVSVNEANEVGMLVSTTRPDIRLPSITPSFGPDHAIRLARAALNARTPALHESERSELTVFRTPAGDDRLAYRVTSVLEDPPGDWELLIDAQTGDELSREDRYVNHDQNSVAAQGSGYVYRRNPLSAARRHYGDPGFTDNNDADSDSLNARRTLVTLDSLTLEDGIYRLSGPSCVITDIESPVDTVLYGEISPDGLRYRRSQPGFEAVMVYYHVTLAHQRLRALGFDSPGLHGLQVDPHGYQGKDNSHYSPGGNWIAFGTGGVDDAEDADVIWHEYGHAIQYTIIPSWGGGECAALGEGFGDYWAASYARSLHEWTSADPEYQWIFGWDGHNPFWSGRILNDARKYPFPPGSVYAGGQIWASALMGIYGDLGRDVTDRLVIKSFYYLSAEATATDNAQAIIQADRDLYGGAHLPTLMYWFVTVKNFIPVTSPSTVLVVNDETPRATDVGSSISDTTTVHKTFSAVLTSLSVTSGLNIQSTTFAGLDTNALASARALVLLGGANPLPFDDPAKRRAIVRFVAEGGRVLIEGGDVGHVYGWVADGEERDVAFRTTLLHARKYLGDGTETTLLPFASDGSVFSQLHNLRSPVAFASSPFARDLMEAEEDAIVMGTWSDDHRTTAVIARLDDADSVRTLYLPFSLSLLADSAVASQLAENALSFLLYHRQEENAGAHPVPAAFQLYQNYPNPFNPTTEIRYTIPVGTRHAVSLRVYDMLGHEVSVLVNEVKQPGIYTVQFDAAHLASGVYFYRLHAGGSVVTRKLVVLR